MNRYVLNADGEPVPEPDLFAWWRWFENTGNRVVDVDTRGDARVSTVFLGLDHAFTNGGAPVLWETMIFGGEHDGYCERYTSQADAVRGHEKALALLRTKAVSV